MTYGWKLPYLHHRNRFRWKKSGGQIPVNNSRWNSVGQIGRGDVDFLRDFPDSGSPIDDSLDIDRLPVVQEDSTCRDKDGGR